MFSRLATLSMLVLPLLAVATPASIVARGGGDSGGGSPTTACCASTQDASSASSAGILSAIGLNAGDVSGLIGLTCSPISVVGVGSGSECSGTTVSCSQGIKGGIGIGCVPVNV